MQPLTHQQYYDALQRAVRANKHRSNNRAKQLAFCHLIVKAAALYPKSDDTKKVKERRDMIQYAVLFLGNLTIEELLHAFPMDKAYDGDKTGQHDYFDSKKAVEAYKAQYNLTNDDPLGNNCLSLLLHYRNTHIRLVMDELTLLLLHTKSDFLNPFFKVATEQQQPQQPQQPKRHVKNTRLHQRLMSALAAKKKILN